MLIDTHAHIIDEKYGDRTPADIVKSAQDAGVNKIVHVACELSDIESAVRLAEEQENVFIAIGYHPIYACDYDQQCEDLLIKYVNHPKVVAIGECGLDYHWKTSTKEEQFNVFRRQIEFAIQFDKPLIIHTRDAMQDTYDILAEYKGQIRGIIHCYSGSIEMAREFIKLGFYISLGGPVTYKNAKAAKEVAVEIDLNYLLVETDCPYLAPEPYRGTINEPKNVVEIAKYIAGIRDMSFEELALITTRNAERLLGL